MRVYVSQFVRMDTPERDDSNCESVRPAGVCRSLLLIASVLQGEEPVFRRRHSIQHSRRTHGDGRLHCRADGSRVRHRQGDFEGGLLAVDDLRAPRLVISGRVQRPRSVVAPDGLQPLSELIRWRRSLDGHPIFLIDELEKNIKIEGIGGGFGEKLVKISAR